MIRKEDISEFIRQNRLWLKEHFHIEKIAIFGSFARNEQTDKSDIDLLIELEDNTPDIHEKKKNYGNISAISSIGMWILQERNI